MFKDCSTLTRLFLAAVTAWQWWCHFYGDFFLFAVCVWITLIQIIQFNPNNTKEIQTIVKFQTLNSFWKRILARNTVSKMKQWLTLSSSSPPIVYRSNIFINNIHLCSWSPLLIYTHPFISCSLLVLDLLLPSEWP